MAAVLEQGFAKAGVMFLQLGGYADGGASAEQNGPDLFGFCWRRQSGQISISYELLNQDLPRYLTPYSRQVTPDALADLLHQFTQL